MLLQARNIGKNYGTTQILSNITLQISARQRIGLVGVNGAGKSTLLKILAGELPQDSGEIYKAKDTTIGYLPQNSGLESEATIWEEMMSVFDELKQMEKTLRELEKEMADPQVHHDLGRFTALSEKYARLSDTFRMKGGYEMEAKIRGILHGMGFAQVPFDTPIVHLSGGQKTRLALAKLLLVEPDILLLDEPTNHLDLATLSWLEDYLRNYPGAILLVSHDRYFLDTLVDTIYEIERTKAKKYTGNYTRFIEQKAAEYESELKQYEKQQEEIARAEEFIRRNIARASTANRAKSRRKMLEKMERIEKPQGESRRAQFRFNIAKTSGKDVLKVKDLRFSYEHGEPILDGIDLELTRGEAVALIGPNGAGKSTLLKLIAGELEQEAGSIEWGSNVSIAYYDQEQKDLNPDNTVLDEVWNEYPHLLEMTVRSVLGHFLFSGEDVEKKISTLSGGEKARVALAKLMLKQANVLILDEPTNHLDLYSKEALESALMEYEGTLLFISHDRYFLNKLAERILELDASGLKTYLGNYDDYIEKKKELAEIEQELAQIRPSASSGQKTGDSRDPAEKSESHARPHYEEMKRKRQEERNRQRKAERLEQEITNLEEEIHNLELELAKPEVYLDHVKVMEIQEEIKRKQRELDKAYTEWESLL